MTVHSHQSESTPAVRRAVSFQGRIWAGLIVAMVLTVLVPDTLHAAENEGGNPIVQSVARLFNFGLLVGILVYYLRTPAAAYLASRSTQIRQDLVTASEMRAAATAQLADIKHKMEALPAELEALTRQGAEDVKAERVRIAQSATIERERLLAQTRREIDMRLRIARRQLVELAADLTVGAARERVRQSITPEDQLHLVDRYTSQLTNTGAR
jgi:F-type H+-transporting ATPase subunit b